MANKVVSAGGAFVKFDYDRKAKKIFESALVTRDQSEFLKQMSRAKSIDYNQSDFLANYIGWNIKNGTFLDASMLNALALQSKKPLYCLEGCGAGVSQLFAEDTKVSLEISNKDGSEIGEDVFPAEIVQRSFNYLKNNESQAQLKYIFFVSNISDYDDEEFVIGNSINYIIYVFKENNSEFYSFVKNNVQQADRGFYRMFTVCRHNITKFEAADGGEICKNIVSPEYYENKVKADDKLPDGLFVNGNLKKRIYAPVKIKIGEIERVGMVFCVGGDCTETVETLQTRILAVQTIMPKSNQIFKDESPTWIAQRLNYEETFVATEDVTLKNGTSYYWDIGECWPARINNVKKEIDTSILEYKGRPWYWDIWPFNPDSDEETYNLGEEPREKNWKLKVGGDLFKGGVKKSLENVGVKYNGSASITKHNTDIRTVNVSPDYIAKKAYGVYLKTNEFDGAGKETLDKGAYFINSMLGTNDGWKEFICEEDQGQKGRKCFINGQEGDVNCGKLYEPKEEILTAYFLVKGAAVSEDVVMQYEIPETLKNGRRDFSNLKNPTEAEEEYEKKSLTGVKYFPSFLKECIKSKGENDKLKENIDILAKQYREELKAENAICVEENKICTIGDFRGTDVGEILESKSIPLSINEVQEFLKSVDDSLKLKKDATDEEKKRYDKIARDIDEEEVYWDSNKKQIVLKQEEMSDGDIKKVLRDFFIPLNAINFVDHFSYIKHPNSVKTQNGDLFQGDYALMFGWHQTKIKEFASGKGIINDFLDLYKDFNIEQYSDKSLLRGTNDFQYPWWINVGDQIYLNQAFIDIFFNTEEDREDGVKNMLRTSTDKKESIGDLLADKDGKISFVIKEKTNGKEHVATVSPDDLKKIQDKFKSYYDFSDGGEYACKVVDEKTDYICDQFFQMILDVYGRNDKKGFARTKGSYVQDTPFELRVEEDNDGKLIEKGYDLREFIDSLSLRLFQCDDEAIRTCINRIGQSLKAGNDGIAWNLSSSSDFDIFQTKADNILNKAVSETQSRFSNEYDKEAMLISMEKFEMEQKLLRRLAEANDEFKATAAAAVVISSAACIAGEVALKVFKKKAGELLIKKIGSAATKNIVKRAVCKVLFASLTGVGVIFLVADVIITAKSIYKIWQKHCEALEAQTRTSFSDDWVYKFTCRAKRLERLYSITKRGSVISTIRAETGKPLFEGDNIKDTGDFERVKSYYNWLAEPGHGILQQPELLEFHKKIFDPNNQLDKIEEGSKRKYSITSNQFRTGYDGRVAVIIPSTDEPLDDKSIYNDFSQNALEKIESFIQTWMGRGQVDVETQGELPIEGYYDMLSGMHPYIEMKLRMGLGTCSRKKIDGGADVFYNEAGQPILMKKEKEYYRVNRVNEKHHVYTFEGDEITAIDEKTYYNEAAGNFRTLNSRDYPFFKSLTIKDNGVKKLQLELTDPNFASYTLGIKSYYSAGADRTEKIDGEGDNGQHKFTVRNDKYTEEDLSGSVFSLEALLRGALRNPTFVQEERMDKYTNDSGKISNDYLAIDETLVVSPTNLKIRYGYDDYNPSKENFYNEDYRYGNRTANLVDPSKRDARWWDTRYFGQVAVNNVREIKKYVADGQINNTGGNWMSTEDALGIDVMRPSVDVSDGNRNSLNEGIDQIYLLKSNAQTTVMSKELDFMITNFKSKLTPTGIDYTIEAIETKDANIIRTRFLQRYASINANPEEVLYILMHMFNEDNEGNNIEGSRVKIILISDEDDKQVPAMRDKLNMSYDLKKIKEKDYDSTMADNLYEMAYQQGFFTINEDFLKKITLSLGGAAATRNYGNGNSVTSYVPLYKTLAQLLNEFCSLCPPKKRIEKRELVTDENGNNVLSNQENAASRPLKWFSVEDKIHDITYVCLYYRTVIKPPRIRVYTYGPNNPTVSCVKSLNIENSNEFAVLSAVRTFDGSRKKVISRMNATTEEKEIDESDTVDVSKFGSSSVFNKFEFVGINSGNYDQAFSNSMYEGTIDLLGDPFWSFDGLMQPCTYPIKINVVMPQSEFTRQVDANTSFRDYEEQINNLRYAFNNRENNFVDGKSDYWYNETHMRRSSVDDNGKSYPSVEKADNVRVHQVLHESSGYYVVKDITQTISNGNFTTTLGIMSYPNIQKDVLLTKNELEDRKNRQSEKS